MPRRFQNWPELMTEFLRENRSLPFSWNGWSCALFALAHADKITGTSHYDAFRVHCTDQESSLEYLNSLGGMEAVATSLFGEPLSTPRKAQRGDIVLVDNEEIETIGIMDMSGIHILILSEERGMISIPISRLRLKMAWRV